MTAARLALGTAQLGLPYGVANRAGLPSEADAFAILRRALDLGVRALDTAPGYGEAEARIGAFLAREGRPEGLRVATKLPRLGPGIAPAGVAAAVDEAVGGSLARLGLPRLDVYLAHDAEDLRRHGASLPAALGRHREAGRLGAVGASAYAPTELPLVEALPGDVAVQYPANVLDRRFPGSTGLASLRARGAETFARSPLLQGLLALAPADLPPRLAAARPWVAAWREVLADFGADPADAALRWAAAAAGEGHVVLGVETVAQLERAVAALAEPLAPDLAEALEGALAGAPDEVIDPRRWAP